MAHICQPQPSFNVNVLRHSMIRMSAHNKAAIKYPFFKMEQDLKMIYHKRLLPTSFFKLCYLESNAFELTWMHFAVTAAVCFAVLSVNSYSASHDNWCTETLWNRIMTAQCEGMGEVGSERYEPALLSPCLSIRVISYSNCQEIHSRQQTGLAV